MPNFFVIYISNLRRLYAEDRIRPESGYQLQVLVLARAWRFKSSSGHHFLESDFPDFFLKIKATPLGGAFYVEAILRPN